MFADIDSIHAFGRANAACAADLAAAAASLSSLPVPPSALGPVAAEFVAALAAAVTDGADRRTGLSGRFAAAQRLAHRAADAYDGADGHAADRIAGS
nr:MAG: hypothetical protein DIU75_19370 [Mycolicibacterium hassiacum]